MELMEQHSCCQPHSRSLTLGCITQFYETHCTSLDPLPCAHRHIDQSCLSPAGAEPETQLSAHPHHSLVINVFRGPRPRILLVLLSVHLLRDEQWPEKHFHTSFLSKMYEVSGLMKSQGRLTESCLSPPQVTCV